jgi:signal transduction histidine kinase
VPRERGIIGSRFMNEQALRVARQVYRLRIFGLGLGFLCIASVFYERGAAPVAWVLLAAHGLVWPHVAWLLARRSGDPHGAERANLIVDSAMGGIFVPLMHFALLPSVLIVAMLSMDKLGWGWRFLAKACGAMALTGVATTVLTRPAVQPETNMPMIVASIPLMVAYPFAVAIVSERSGRLARERKKAVEQMAELREQLAHIARVGTLGEMAAGLAHELNQPLTAIHLEAEAALQLGSTDPAELRGTLTRIGDQSLRAGDIVRRMRAFARRGETTREAIDVGVLVHEVLALLDHDLRLGQIQIMLLLRDGMPPVEVDRVAIQQVLVNLIRNAMEAMAAPAVLTRRLTIATEATADCVRVSVTDTGGGVDPAVLARLFHPFQTTKSAGLGLGLSICQTLVEAHGGRVGAGPHPAHGALFFFELPMAPGRIS